MKYTLKDKIQNMNTVKQASDAHTANYLKPLGLYYKNNKNNRVRLISEIAIFSAIMWLTTRFLPQNAALLMTICFALILDKLSNI